MAARVSRTGSQKLRTRGSGGPDMIEDLAGQGEDPGFYSE